jgi:hypothetical protein
VKHTTRHFADQQLNLNGLAEALFFSFLFSHFLGNQNELACLNLQQLTWRSIATIFASVSDTTPEVAASAVPSFLLRTFQVGCTEISQNTRDHKTAMNEWHLI